MLRNLLRVLGLKWDYNQVYDNYTGFSPLKFLHYSRTNKSVVISNTKWYNIYPEFNICEYLTQNGFELLTFEYAYRHFYNGKFLVTVYDETYNYNENEESGVKKLKVNKSEYGLTVSENELENNFQETKEVIKQITYYRNEHHLYEKFLNDINKFINHKKDKKRYINFLTKNSSGFTTTSSLLEKTINIDFKLNYNDNFEHEKVQSYIDDETNGLILLGGQAGSGKSYYIKYLIHNIDRDFIYIPNEYINLMTSPEFISFAISNLKDYVVILEDCENVLISRDLVKNSAVPTILNLTDGIIGDILNLTIIGTYNTSDKIDTALFRKGRLLYEYHFDKLSVEKCNELSKKLGYNKNYTEPVPLADVYNIEENRTAKYEEKKIGFKK